MPKIPKRTGRPKKKLLPKTEAELVQSLAEIGCTFEEIAGVCRCGLKTVKRRYGRRIHQWRQGAKTSLRRAQWKAAVKNLNPRMLVHLGKHMLGQHDKPTVVREVTELDLARLLQAAPPDPMDRLAQLEDGVHRGNGHQ